LPVPPLVLLLDPATLAVEQTNVELRDREAVHVQRDGPPITRFKQIVFT
jgi:hypothetical protein